MSITRWAALAVALFSAGVLSAATTYTFQTFTGSGGGGTEAWGINGAGEVAGFYATASGNFGFEYNPASNSFTTLTGPQGASDIRAFGINDSGAIVGDYRDSSNVTPGFIYSNGTYKTIDAAGAQYGTTVTGINDSGQLALTYSTAVFNSAYRWTPSGTGYTSQSLSVASDGTFAAGINNNGEIAGYYQTPNYGGYLWNNNGTSSTFLEPNDQGGTTQGLDVNDSGEVVGSWFSPTGEAGYVDLGGVFTPINAPGSTYTYVTGVNDGGEITGWYLDASDQMHSFIATAVPEPATLAMLALCAVVVETVGEDATSCRPQNSSQNRYFALTRRTKIKLRARRFWVVLDGFNRITRVVASQNKILVLAFLSLALPVIGADWRLVTPEELALKQSKTDPNADAECLFRDVRIENNVTGSVQNRTTNYIRFKIFNDRGREKYANRTIEYVNKENVSDVGGRTIHPDGTIIDVKRDAIFDKVEVKKGGEKVRAISFAFPSVEPGSIIEYRWAKDEGETLYRYIPLDVQTEYPVDEVTFHIKPAYGINGGVMPEMRVMNFGCNPEKGNVDSKGFYPFTVRNVPAYYDEPYSPPGLTAKRWILIYYEENDKIAGDKYWDSIGKDSYNKAKEQIKVNGEMKQAAAGIVAPGKTDDEKLALIAEYCRKNLKNIRGADITTEEREAYKPNNNSTDTFRRKVGTSEDIDFVFIALAQAAGYDARHARVADRSWFLFNPQVRSAFFLNNSDAAVLVNDKWKFYDVSNEFSPPGTLAWPEQGVFALMPDSKNSEWVQTPLLNSEQTKIQRIAELTLSPNGDMQGIIRELFWGNESIRWRLAHAHQNDSERETFIRERLKERYADFEVSDIRVTVSPDANRPVGVAYHLSVKGYCQRTGKRLFVLPSFFTVGRPAYFTDANRMNPIYFDYPWSESDSVDIHLPAGFQLDHADAPRPIDFPPIGKYAARVSIANDTNTLLYRRALVFGADKLLRFLIPRSTSN